MYRVTTIILGLLLFTVGLIGFFQPNLNYTVQFDLFQSLLYIVAGAVGITLGLGKHSIGSQWLYVRIIGICGIVLLLLGLTFPNFMDIVHLEIPEHIFHAIIGLGALFASDRKNFVT